MAKIKLKPGKAQPATFKTKALTYMSHTKWFLVAMALLTYIIIREIVF